MNLQPKQPKQHLQWLLLLSLMLLTSTETLAQGIDNAKVQRIVNLAYSVATFICIAAVVAVIAKGIIEVMGEQQGGWKKIGVAFLVGIIWFGVMPTIINLFFGMIGIQISVSAGELFR